MATDKKKFARPSDSMVTQLKDMIQKYGPKAKVYDPDALEAARAAVKEPQNYGADEFRIIMADLKAAAAQNFAVEDGFYFKGKKQKFGMASEQAMALYRKLNSSGTAITNSNWREWDRLASSAMKMPDFTPPGQSESLHDLANEVGIEIQALKSRASRPGEKAKFAHEWTASDDREADRVIQSMKALEAKCSAKRSEIFEIETKIIPRVIALATAAKKEKNERYLLAAINTASHADNVRYSFSRPGEKAKFQLPSADAYKQKELLRTATLHANNLTHQLFGLGQTIKSTGEQAQRMSQHYQTLIQDAQTPKEMAMVAAEIVKYAGKMARDLSASLREPIK